VVILELIHAQRPDSSERSYLLDTEPIPSGLWMIHDKRTERVTRVDAVPFKFLTYQLSPVGYWPTGALTGNGELGFDSGEGARETATTSKEGSRRANYPILT
jgi:hypothetical protein